MDKLELDEDLRRVKLSRRRDSKDLLAKMSTLEIKFGILITASKSKKAAVVLRDGQKD
jgi:hypothetical protein